MLMEGSGIRELAERVGEHLNAPPAPLPETSAAAAPGESDLRLSHGQQMLWYAHQFATTGDAYHITGAATIRADAGSGRLPAGIPACHRPAGRLADDFHRRR